LSKPFLTPTCVGEFVFKSLNHSIAGKTFWARPILSHWLGPTHIASLDRAW
jgi:hypothetical protein